MALWTPAEITTALWLDASDSSTITTVSGGVSEWRDKSGNLRHAVQDESAYRPTIGSVNGNSAINTASSKFLKHSSAKSLLRNRSHAIIAIVYNTQVSSFGTYGVFAFSHRGIDDNNLAVRYQATCSSTGKIAFQSRRLDNDSGPSLQDTSINAGTTFRVCTSSLGWASGSQEHYVDGILRSTANYTSSGNTPDTDLADTGEHIWMALGVQLYPISTTPLYLNGMIAEVVVLAKATGAYSEEDRQQLEGFLAWKWGLQANLPGDHTYKTAAPTIVTGTPVSTSYDTRFSLSFDRTLNHDTKAAIRTSIQYQADTMVAVRQAVQSLVDSAVAVSRNVAGDYDTRVAISEQTEVSVDFDTVARISRAVDFDGDLLAGVSRGLSLAADTRVVVTTDQSVTILFDSLVAISRELASVTDARVAISRGMLAVADAKVAISTEVVTAADTVLCVSSCSVIMVPFDTLVQISTEQEFAADTYVLVMTTAGWQKVIVNPQILNITPKRSIVRA